MSHAVARTKLRKAQSKLAAHNSKDPEHELSPERIAELQEEIELAQNHLEDEPDDFEPSYREEV